MTHEPPPGRWLVQFTEHATYEMEVAANGEDEAIGIASEHLSTFGASVFEDVEQHRTDWSAVSLDGLPFDTAELVTDGWHRPFEPVVLAPESAREAVRLLNELRDSTLSRRSFEQASRLISMLTMAAAP